MIKNQKILIYGIGNELLTDDGIGPKLVMELQKSHQHKNLVYESAFVGGLDILDIIRGYRQVVFLDAIKTKDGIPGTIYHFTPDDFKETLHLSNLHDIKFLTALELGKRLNYEIPTIIEIIAIEIIEDMVYNDHFSPEIEKLYPAIHQKIGTYLIDKTNCKSSIPEIK
ncbi:MAG: hydrogenase maturation protease [Bacteroidales bacterium]|jgi:hydrogenase maturation protease|nr:hydrogenase maturation protease [Bacteroidales bacterium]